MKVKKTSKEPIRVTDRRSTKTAPRGREPVVPMAPPPAPVKEKPKGIRVHVMSGDQMVDLGDGTYVAEVPVYFFQMPDGSLRSAPNAEEKPPADAVPEGAKVVWTSANPKIILDSGQTVYGCQVWWEPIIPDEYNLRYDQAVVRFEKTIDPDVSIHLAIVKLLKKTAVRRMVTEMAMKAEAKVDLRTEVSDAL